MVKCPFCKKEVKYDPSSDYSIPACEHCYRKFHSDFSLYDFFKNNSHLFLMMSVFGGIAVILPIFASSEILEIPTNPIFFKAPLTFSSSMIKFFIQISIFTSLVLMGMVMVMIYGELNRAREYELIFGQIGSFTVRTFDLERSLFSTPFIFLGFSLGAYILVILGDFFMYFTIFTAILYAIIFLVILKQNPLFRKYLLDKQEPQK